MSVRYAILGLLAQHPRHGYDLRAAFTAVIGGDQNWDVKPAQIYATLNRLVESGWIVQSAIEQEGGPEKHIYSITELGQQALMGWFAERVTPDHQHDEFFIKLMIALASNLADPHQLIQTQRLHLFQDLHAATAQRNRYNPKTEMALILLMEKTMMHLEADLRWLEMCEVRLEEIQSQPFAAVESRPRGRPKKSDL